jgi:3-oxoacyl-[acyl-carrier protein] reductase
LVADLTDQAQFASLEAEILAWRAAVDIVVNNAGMVSLINGWDAEKLLEELTLAEWDEAFARNLCTGFLVTQAFPPSMKTRGYCRIVYVSSTTGPLVAMPPKTTYATAKAAMVAPPGPSRSRSRRTASQ